MLYPIYFTHIIYYLFLIFLNFFKCISKDYLIFLRIVYFQFCKTGRENNKKS